MIVTIFSRILMTIKCAPAHVRKSTKNDLKNNKPFNNWFVHNFKGVPRRLLEHLRLINRHYLSGNGKRTRDQHEGHPTQIFVEVRIELDPIRSKY